ncbi:MAG: hypothetical protein Q8K12_17465 [Thiobacillus sp.]|nr:hypothetical protein [Thiobacillus sp.]
MTKLWWHINQWARRIGGAGLVGMGLLIAALLLQLTQVEPSQRASLAQRDKLALLQLEAASQDAVPIPVPFNPLAMLPPTGEAAQLIGELERMAQVHGFELPRGQYSVTPLTATSLLRWQLILPVEASYPALHAFIATALERLPNLTLDELKLKRERIEDGVLQAELRLSFFVETAP